MENMCHPIDILVTKKTICMGQLTTNFARPNNFQLEGTGQEFETKK
jgi:hypothetical protein